jgi:hypothetical protein
MNSFQKMEETYRSNPKFGNSNQLRAEMEQLRVKIVELEAALAQLRFLVFKNSRNIPNET